MTLYGVERERERDAPCAPELPITDSSHVTNFNWLDFICLHSSPFGTTQPKKISGQNHRSRRISQVEHFASSQHG